MTAKFVEMLEEKAYNIARTNYSDKCFKTNFLDKKLNNGKSLPVSRLFDMVAGSETGAIIGGALITPKDSADPL